MSNSPKNKISNFTDEQKFTYEESMKYYRDLKNVIDKSYDDGKLDAIYKVAKNLKENKVDTEIIIRSTGLTKEQIENL